MSMATRTIGEVAAPSLAATEDTIDRQHLSRMTLGDRDLEREVLMLFKRQASMLLHRMAAGERSVAAIAAHTLKGSAQSIGAWRVAQAAEAVEYTDAATQGAAVAALGGAIEEARVVIDRLLGAH